tara:strand:+ start:26536 stop:27213 length:678 start_codon:yes stop_codon:yes gene_type:complete
MKVIAFSLWGDDPKYTLGAIQNASLAKIVYPGWTCRYYVGQSTPEHIIDLLKEFDNVEIVMMVADGDWTGMFWRFEAASDPNIDVLLVRDCDSRLWFREKAAVDEWLASDKVFHIMRDHEFHTAAIMGGMWGVKGDFLRNMSHWVSTYKGGNYWQTDQQFLKIVVYPLIKEKAYTHDTKPNTNPFSGERDENHFVGQSYAGSGRVLHLDDVYFQDYMRDTYANLL